MVRFSSFKCLPSFFGLVVLLWLCVSLPEYHQGTSVPISTLDSCLALTSNLSHASLAVPSLKYLWFNFNQTATAGIQVGAVLQFMGQAQCIWYGQNHLSNLLPISPLLSSLAACLQPGLESPPGC